MTLPAVRHSREVLARMRQGHAIGRDVELILEAQQLAIDAIHQRLMEHFSGGRYDHPDLKG